MPNSIRLQNRGAHWVIYDKKRGRFTGYVQQVNGNRKSDHGSNHYFDLYLQVSEEKNHMIRVMTTRMDDTTKNQLFRDKQQAKQPITITNLRVTSSGTVFMYNNTVIKDIPTMSLPFKYVPPEALPVTSIADIIKNKKGGTVTWNGDPKTPNNSNHKVRDRKLIDSSRVIDISIWEDNILQIKEGEFFQITNCKVKHFYGKKLSTMHETVIQPAEQQNITDADATHLLSRNTKCCHWHACNVQHQSLQHQNNRKCRIQKLGVLYIMQQSNTSKKTATYR